MKRYLFGMVLSSMVLCGAAIADHEESDPYALEPSINGGVSASGLFASQEEEDAYLAELLAEGLEPCINGGVSASGLYASQAEEAVYTASIAVR